MTSKFIETKMVEVKTIRHLTNGSGPNSTLMSVVPNNNYRVSCIDLVIGASFEHRCASAFNKGALVELIQILTEIKDTM